jgi:hypothetical protein
LRILSRDTRHVVAELARQNSLAGRSGYIALLIAGGSSGRPARQGSHLAGSDELGHPRLVHLQHLCEVARQSRKKALSTGTRSPLYERRERRQSN